MGDLAQILCQGGQRNCSGVQTLFLQFRVPSKLAHLAQCFGTETLSHSDETFNICWQAWRVLLSSVTLFCCRFKPCSWCWSPRSCSFWTVIGPFCSARREPSFEQTFIGIGRSVAVLFSFQAVYRLFWLQLLWSWFMLVDPFVSLVGLMCFGNFNCMESLATVMR